MNEPLLAVTSGEPAGIGIDICLDLPNMDLPCPVVVLGDETLLAQRAAQLGRKVRIQRWSGEKQPAPDALNVYHIPLRVPCTAGQLDPRNSPYVVELLDKAMDGIAYGVFAGMVTAPVHKGVINQHYGDKMYFSGHTEYLAERSGTPQVVMMLAGGGLRVALLTTHLPLKDVAGRISPELVESVARILDKDLREKFRLPQPKILLAGLNPHAGENGYLGREEIDIMQPAARKLREIHGIDITDPLPADTLFQPFYLDGADAVLAAYHDQGLPVLKYAAFGKGVNITLGLPFVRTSVDHGTALDLAGTGKAHSGSLHAAVLAAFEMAGG